MDTDKLIKSFFSNKTFLLYTLCNFFNQLAYGIANNVVGPALVDLQHVYNADLKTITYTASCLSLGYMLGSLVGWIYQWVNRQVLLIVFLTIQAITIAIAPFCGFVWLLFLALVITGIGGGAYDSSSSVWLVEMFPKFAGPLLQVAQFMYGLGTVLGPLLVMGFVYGEVDNTSNSTNITSEVRQHSLMWPFGIAGLFQLVVPLAFLVLYFTRPYERNLVPDSSCISNYKRPSIYNTLNSRASFRSIRTNVSLQSSRRQSLHFSVVGIIDPSQVRYRFLKLSLCAIAIGAYASVDVTYFYFSSQYMQHLSDPMSASQAASLVSLLSAAYSLGRLVAAGVSVKLQPGMIVAYHHIISLIGQAIIFFGRESRVCIYSGTIIFGLGISALWPGMLAFTEQHLRLTDKVSSIFSFITGMFSLISPLIITLFIESHPNILFVVCAGLASLSLTAFISVVVLIRLTR